MLVLGLIEIPWWLIFIAVILLYVLYTTKDFNYFKNQGLPYNKPLPFVGTTLALFKKGPAQYDLDAQERFGSDSVVGDFALGNATIIAYNADFLSKMMISEFPSFTNRFRVITGSRLSENMLIALTDNHWKHVRNGMTPTFTTGKLKKMTTEMNRCAQDLVNNMTKAMKKGESIAAKEFTGAFTMDVIASTAFGLRINSQEDPDNPFVQNAKTAFDLQLTSPKLLFPLFFPNASKFLVSLGLSYELAGKEQVDFFSGVTKQTLAMRREDEDSSRTDFIQLMIKAQRGENIRDKEDEAEEEDQSEEELPVKGRIGLSTDEIVSNSMMLFTVGYDTTATSLQYFLYNMATHPEIQDRLVEEIEQVLGMEGTVDYTKLSELPYLDQCVNENLRIYPPAIRVDREAGNDVTINDIHVRKGMIVHIPIFAIHHDPKKWPEPDKFDPERFRPENKKDRHPFHFLPFGHGPRNCIGRRLALLEIKMAVIYVLRAFKITKCDKTPYPLTFQLKGLLWPKEEIVVAIEPRNA